MKRPMRKSERHPRFLGLLGLVLACSVTAGDWPLFRGDAGLTGVGSDTLPEKLEPLWVFEAEDGFASAVAVSDGAVYAGSLDGYLYVLDLDSGELRWKYKASAAIKASPAVSDGLVFFGDEDGTFHAVDIDTQQRKWSFEAEAEIVSSANIAAGAVIFGSHDESVYCLGAADGSLRWQVRTQGFVYGTPALSEGHQVISHFLSDDVLEDVGQLGLWCFQWG